MTASWLAGLHSDVRDFAQSLLAQGWTYDRTSSNSHPRLVWPENGGTVSLPSTPSDHRWLANCTAQARRISGQRERRHRGPRFQTVRGSGFDLDMAAREQARRDTEAAELRERIASIDDELLALDVCRQRTRAAGLARARVRAAERLSQMGAEAPAPPEITTRERESA